MCGIGEGPGFASVVSTQRTFLNFSHSTPAKDGTQTVVMPRLRSAKPMIQASSLLLMSMAATLPAGSTHWLKDRRACAMCDAKAR